MQSYDERLTFGGNVHNFFILLSIFLMLAECHKRNVSFPIECVLCSTSTTAPATNWSQCSMEQFSTVFQNGADLCLYNIPKTLEASTGFCGNGIVESGEQCDCGNSSSQVIDICLRYPPMSLGFSVFCKFSKQFLFSQPFSKYRAILYILNFIHLKYILNLK